MSLSNTNNKVIYSGNGVTTVWSYSFPIPDATYLSVIYTDADGVETTISSSNYTVTGIGTTTGGSVTYPTSGSPIASGTKLTLVRTVPYTQPTVFTNQGGYFPEVTESRLDQMMMAIQQLYERSLRSFSAPVSDSASIGDLPTSTTRANSGAGSFLAFDGSGNPYAGSLTALTSASTWISNNLLPAVSAAASRTVLGVPGLADNNTMSGNNTLSGNNTFSGTNTFPTQSAADNSTKAATTAYADRVLANMAIKVQKFTSSGTYTPDANLVYCIIECVGGGGGGASAASGAGLATLGGGGGSGGYSRKMASKSAIGASQTVTIGAAGTGATAGANNGGNGGDTSVGTLCIAKGGSGGAAGTAGTPNAAGGAGGVAGTGDIAIPGTSGETGGIVNYSTGAVGPLGGHGASSVFGGGTSTGSNGSGSIAGTAAPANSGAGGSAAWCLNGSNQAGGDGGTGYVIVTEFCKA